MKSLHPNLLPEGEGAGLELLNEYTLIKQKLYKMLRKFIIPVIIFVFAIAFFKLMLATKDESVEIEIEEHVWRVEQTIIKKLKLSPAITLYGRIETSELLNAAAPAAGQVAKVLVKEGQHIDKGQLMLALEAEDFEPLIKQSQGKVNELKALIKSELLRHEVNLDSLKNEKKLLLLSEKALNRAEKVKRQNLGSVSETEQAMQKVEKQRMAYNSMQFSVNEHEARQEQLQARLLQAEAELSRNQLAFKRSQIYAPFKGVVAKVNVAQGDRVNSNEKLLSFYSMEGLDIRAKLPINMMAEVQQNIRDGHVLTGMASNGGQQVPVILKRLSGEGQASGVDAILSMQANGSHFRIGSIAVVRLQRMAQGDLIAVPYQAMYGTDRLYKIVDNRLQSVTVQSVGEYAAADKNSAMSLDQSQKMTQLLIRSDELNSGDAILSTHLPNAFSGLKVDLVE